MATSISLTWEQPRGADAVDSYEIKYNFTIDECSGHNFPLVTVMLNNHLQRSYIITNSSTTPVEEDSTYSISLTAIYNAGRSTATTVTSTVKTAPAAPSGPPQSLMAISVNLLNITVQWQEVDCRQRNGYISSYLLIYTVYGETVEILTNDTMFTAVGLQPRTNYTFTVKASHYGPPTSITVETAASQGT